MLKVKVFLNLAYNDVIRKVLLKGRFGLVDLESGQAVCFSSKAVCAAAAPAALRHQTMWRTSLSTLRLV